MSESAADVAAVVIGRNEGERLVRCLVSLVGEVTRIVYVDSGSTDGSLAVAAAGGAETFALDMSSPFTAARARNAGLEVLSRGDVPAFVQFIDGDCEICPGWIAAAQRYLSDHPGVAAVAGRLRERYPEASIYNYLADAEWDHPSGPAAATGGIAMMRTAAVIEVDGFNPDLIAGEEPELCLRLRRAGWGIWRLPDDMAFHDAAMTRFSQWWKRARRAGHAYAEGAAMHGADAERYCVKETWRALAWGAGVPLAAALGAIAIPQALAVLLLWPVQVVRLKLGGTDWVQAFFLTLGKLPEAQGVVSYHVSRLRGRKVRLIEYK